MLLLIDCKQDPEFVCEYYCNNIIDSNKINRKVLIVGIDGFRSDALLSSTTPFIYNMIEDKNVYYNFSHNTELYTLSGPNWSSMLTGVHCNKHNVIDNSFSNSNYTEYPPFFYYIENSDIANDINTISIVNWSPINTNILSSYVDHSDSKSNDSLVFLSVKDFLVGSTSISPDILFLQFDELDGVGHNYGFSSNIPEYRNKLMILDNYVQQLYGFIQQRRDNGEDWLICIVSDHGGDGNSHSDGNNPYINKTILIFEHPNLSFKQNYISNQTDIPANIFSFIGLYNELFNSKSDGELIFYGDD
tara:strand:+ start:404 stop:1312 length:909 start_codon:yes stop_codon:yes gene_type:complete